MIIPTIWLEATHVLSSRGRNRTGIGHYTEELITNLADLNSKASYTVVGNVFITSPPRFLNPRIQNIHYRLTRLFPGKVWNQLFKKHVLPPLNMLIPGKPDLVVFFNFVRYPVTPGTKTMVVIHDLAYEKYPQTIQGRNRTYLQSFVPRAAHNATRLIAVSDATKRDIVEIYGVKPEKISVVYPGVDTKHFKPTKITNAVRDRYKLPEKYFLFVSTLEPRKNVSGIIDAYRALPDSTKREYGLVLTGGAGWLAEDIMSAIAEGDPIGAIIKTSFVGDEDMPSLYSGASAFIFPSLYEGFGIPILEAMACGTPVITANNSSLPEAGGDAAIYISADNTPAITAAILRLISNSSLSEDLIKKGLERASEFSWEKSAVQMQAAIERALE